SDPDPAESVRRRAQESGRALRADSWDGERVIRRSRRVGKAKRAHQLFRLSRASMVGTALARLCPPYGTESSGTRPYRIVIASPLRSAFAIKPTCVPLSSSTAPFWLVSTMARAP